MHTLKIYVLVHVALGLWIAYRVHSNSPSVGRGRRFLRGLGYLLVVILWPIPMAAAVWEVSRDEYRKAKAERKRKADWFKS